MKKSLLISGIIAVFVIAAAVNFYPQNVDQSRGERFRSRMSEKLNLTDEQKDKIAQFRFKNQEEMIDLRANLQKKRLALKELESKGNYSRADYLNLVKDMNAARDNIATAKANHRMDVYELLTDQQKKIFDNMPKMGRFHREGRGMMDGQRRPMRRQAPQN